MMLFIIVLLVVLLAVVIVPKLSLPFADDANLGWMSDQWLAEQRASHRH